MEDQQFSTLETSVLEVASNDDDSVTYTFDRELHAKILMENLDKMQKSQSKKEHSLTNIKFSGIDGVAISFHSVVLASCSTTMKDSLTENFANYNGEFAVPDIASAGVNVLRDFAYGHDVTITSSNVGEAVKIAKLYNIDDLQALCEGYINEATDRNGKVNELEKSFEVRADGILGRLDHMWQADELTDVVLQDEEQKTELHCHLSCIAAASPYFWNMCAFAEGLSSIPLKGLSGKALNSLIGYVYTAMLTVDSDTASDLFVASCKFQLPDITKAVSLWLDAACYHNNAVGILELADLVQSDLECVKILRENTKQFIVQNFADLVKNSEEFEMMSLANLKEVITHNELAVESEENVFDAVMLWVRHEQDKRAAFLPELLCCVRLEYTSSDFLKTILQEPLIQKFPSCVKMIEEAMDQLDDSQSISESSIKENFSPTSAFTDSQSEGSNRRSSFSENEYRDKDNNDCVDDDDDDDNWVDDDDAEEEYEEDDEKKIVVQNSQTPERKIQVNQKKDKDIARKLDFEDEIPRRKNGQPDMRFKVNRSKYLEPGLNKDKSVDKRKRGFKNLKVKGLVPSDPKEKVFVPLRKDGKLDRRFKVNQEILKQELVKTKPLSSTGPGPKKKDGTLDMRFAVNKDSLQNSQFSAKSCSLKPVKKDGTPDMRYNCNKNPSASPQKTSSKRYQEPLKKNGTTHETYQSSRAKSPHLTDLFTAVPLKKDGTPDRRFVVNKGFSGSPSSAFSDIGYSNVSAPSGPLKKDGTPDKRYAVNKGYSGSSSSAFSDIGYSNVSAPSFISSGPLKRDGTPDRRFAVNKGYYGSSSSAFSASGSSSVSALSFTPRGPLKKDGTPDMRYKANRR